jgi:hypothetical protein
MKSLQTNLYATTLGAKIVFDAQKYRILRELRRVPEHSDRAWRV